MALSKTLSLDPILMWTKTIRTHIHRMAHPNPVSDSMLFLKNWRASPGRVGAILPSWPALSAAITREIGPDHAPVLELGCGTGAFTRKIIQRGVPAEELVLIETDPVFATLLRGKFPHSRVLSTDACELHLSPTGIEGLAGAVVCGLPLLNMSTKQQLRILQGVLCTLRPNGALYLFSYGIRCPIPMRLLDRLGLRARKLETVLWNAPPARVWKVVRRARVS